MLRPGSSYKLSWRPQVPVKLRQGQVPVQILHPFDPLRKDSELWVPATPPNSFASPALQADTEVVAAALASPFYAELPPPVPPSCVLRFAGGADHHHLRTLLLHLRTLLLLLLLLLLASDSRGDSRGGGSSP